jgi:hypothetical protein
VIASQLPEYNIRHGSECEDLLCCQYAYPSAIVVRSRLINCKEYDSHEVTGTEMESSSLEDQSKTNSDVSKDRRRYSGSLKQQGYDIRAMKRTKALSQKPA